MAGKLIIRRIGSVLPTLILLLIIALGVLVAWLTIWGAPGWVLRYVEQRAAEQGITLKLDALELEPSRGLAARATGVRLYAAPGEARPLLTAQSIAAGVNVSHLLMGHIRPSFLAVEGGALSLPVTTPPGENLELKNLQLTARMGRGSTLELSSGRAELQGIPLKLQGSLDTGLLTRERSADDAAPPDFKKLIADNQSVIDKAYSLITRQQWQPGEIPSIELRLDMVENFRIHLRGSIPRFDIGQFHFRNAAVDLLHNNNAIVINALSFDTIEPDTSASLQGGYDLGERRLSFTMKSTAALIRMVRSMSEGALRDYLFKFRHPDDSPPQISLSGDVSFGEDYSLLSARVRGEVLQKELKVGATLVDELHLSFFYNNGDFSVDKLELLFPDGSLQAVASAQGGKGQAQLVADLPVQKMLTLVNELASSPVELPEGLSLGERVNLTLHARFSAPAFMPGRTDWQDFVPTLYMLGGILKADHLAYGGYELSGAELQLRAADIEQNADTLLPGALGSLSLTLSADRARATLGSGAATLSAPKLSLEAADLRLSEDMQPRSLGSTSLSFSAEHAGVALSSEAELQLSSPGLQLRVQGLVLPPAGSAPCTLEGGSLTLRADEAHLPREQQPLTLGSTELAVELAELSLPSLEAPEGLSIARSQATLRVQSAALGSLSTGRLEAHLDDVQQLSPLRSGGPVFSSARLSATAAELTHGELALGTAELHCRLHEHTKGTLTLQTTREPGAPTCTLTAAPDWTDPRYIVLRGINLELPADTLALALSLLGQGDNPYAEVPGPVSLSGECTLSRSPLALSSASYRLEAQQIVRTPHRQPALRGRRVPISLLARGTLTAARGGELSYRTSLRLTHATGALDALVTGSTAGRLRITGSSTIRPDIVDQLIDSEDAHSIIRDFRFPATAAVSVSGIDARIDYTNGLRVESDCRLELQNTEYMISVIEDTPGGERMRQDMGPSPYTLLRRASCGVKVFVHQDKLAPDGSPVPDEGVVTITSPELVYDNTPWLRRAKIQNGVRESRLRGEKVIIDIERSFLELHRLSGAVYPAYSLGMFYPSLVGYLEDVHLQQPAQLQTPQCVFPIYSDCKRPMSGTIRVLVPSGGAFHFIGTDIPLQDFSGFVYLTDNYVQLDRLNAKCWEGVLDAAVKIGITGRRTSFDGYAKAQCMNLKLIAASYDSQQEPALCHAEIRFRSPSTNLKDIRAYGEVSIEDGDLMRLSLFHPVSELISDLPEHFARLEKQVSTSTGQPEKEPGFFSRLFTGIFRSLGSAVGKTSGGLTETASYIPGMNHLIAYDLQSAYSKFDIINGHLITRNMKAKGYNLNVHLNLDLNLDTLYLSGNLWPRISSLPTILLSPLTFLSDYMLDINVYGHVGDIKWSIGLDRMLPGQTPSATSEPDRETQPRSAKKR